MASDPVARAPNHLQLMTRVMGLAIAYPFSQDNPERCQLCEVRGLAMPERIEWVRSLSPGEMQRAFDGHQACLKALEQLSDDCGDS